MAHPLEDVMRQSEGFVLIGDSSEGRFPAQSFHCYTTAGARFYCLDLGGLSESRGASKGRKVYASVEELPADRSDLAILWMKPESAKRGVEVAQQAGCKRVWFSFWTNDKEAVEHARELGLEVVEIGRCPVHYIENQVPACRAHTVLLQLTGAYKKPPQTDPSVRRRELV